jgi:hypothetical protein
MTTKQDASIVVTVHRTYGRVEYSFPFWWSIAAVTVATALAVFGVAAVQAGWFR